MTIKCDADCEFNKNGECQSFSITIEVEEEYGHPVCQTLKRPPKKPMTEEEIAHTLERIKDMIENPPNADRLYVNPETGDVTDGKKIRR
ncbi:MAG: hypothetical protein A2W25_04250 [candidate division Zixibacteria bacterium RBG_16_53_22]|nr:MAG: hypothetical protein A2W25_04250 [candidate division Zixibacteria bacterium RBG_16_53_22]